MTIIETLRSTAVIPVVVLERAADAPALAEAMVAGNLPVAEVTFRTAAAPEAIRTMGETTSILVGAGTVLTVAQAKQAHACGAKFIVSPGTNLDVVRCGLDLGMEVFPGGVTPTEISTILSLGLSTVKFFPANIYGGAEAIKALSGPFPDVSFIPTGGVSATNASQYLALPSVAAVGGSWMVPKGLIASGNFDEITRLCAEAVAVAQSSRVQGE